MRGGRLSLFAWAERVRFCLVLDLSRLFAISTWLCSHGHKCGQGLYRWGIGRFLLGWRSEEGRREPFYGTPHEVRDYATCFEPTASLQRVVFAMSKITSAPKSRRVVPQKIGCPGSCAFSGRLIRDFSWWQASPCRKPFASASFIHPVPSTESSFPSTACQGAFNGTTEAIVNLGRNAAVRRQVISDGLLKSRRQVYLGTSPFWQWCRCVRQNQFHIKTYSTLNNPTLLLRYIRYKNLSFLLNLPSSLWLSPQFRRGIH